MLSRHELRQSYRYCTRLSKREARNFYYSFVLLPPAKRRAMCALYAFMRHTDDLADEPADPAVKQSALDAWKLELDRSLAGETSSWPGFPALADTVHRYEIPRDLLHEVIEGVSMDIVPKSYDTIEHLHDYCYHVASVVGLSCIRIWGYRSNGGEAEKLAVSCGIALQLTNILRDVREDALNGRIYLPREDLERFGVNPDDFPTTHLNDRLRNLLAFEAERAYSYYRQAYDLIPLVSAVGRPVLRTIIGIYKGVLDEIVRRDYNVFDGRVSLSGWRKSMIAVRSLSGRTGRQEFVGSPPKAEPPHPGV